MFVDQHKEVEYDLTKPRIAVYKSNWKIHQNAVSWCHMRVAQSKGLQFYQTRSNATILYNTLPTVCIEKVVNMKSGGELHSKMYQPPESPQRIVLKPKLHHGRQDSTNFEARASVDHLSREYGETRSGRVYGETRCGNIDFRIRGLPHSAVQQQDDTHKEAVKKLIHLFDTHPNREALNADLEKDQAFNPCSEKSKDMIRSMGNTEYLEMCEITSKVQCHNCLTYWTTGIVYCTCGTCLRPSDKHRKLNKDRFDVLSIPNYVIKKGPSHGARNGKTERQRIHYAAHIAARKARKKEYKSILDRFLNSPRRILRPLRHDCSRRSFLYRDTGRAEQK